MRQGMGRMWAGTAVVLTAGMTLGLVGLVGLGGCGPTKDVLPEGERELSAAEMAGTWVVSTINGQAVAEDVAPRVDIWGDGKISGTTGVNRFSSKFTIEAPLAGRVKLEPIAMTKRGGTAAQMDLETKFSKALESSNMSRVKGDVLIFRKDEVQTLTLQRKGM